MKTLGMISGKQIMKEAGGIMKEEVEVRPEPSTCNLNREPCTLEPEVES